MQVEISNRPFMYKDLMSEKKSKPKIIYLWLVNLCSVQPSWAHKLTWGTCRYWEDGQWRVRAMEFSGCCEGKQHKETEKDRVSGRRGTRRACARGSWESWHFQNDSEWLMVVNGTKKPTKTRKHLLAEAVELCQQHHLRNENRGLVEKDWEWTLAGDEKLRKSEPRPHPWQAQLWRQGGR